MLFHTDGASRSYLVGDNQNRKGAHPNPHLEFPPESPYESTARASAEQEIKALQKSLDRNSPSTSSGLPPDLLRKAQFSDTLLGALFASTLSQQQPGSTDTDTAANDKNNKNNKNTNYNNYNSLSAPLSLAKVATTTSSWPLLHSLLLLAPSLLPRPVATLAPRQPAPCAA